MSSVKYIHIYYIINLYMYMSTYIQLSLNIYIYLYSYIGIHFCNSRNKTFRTRVCMCSALLNKTKSFFTVIMILISAFTFTSRVEKFLFYILINSCFLPFSNSGECPFWFLGGLFCFVCFLPFIWF